MMAQIDHSIYLQQQGPDFGKAFEGFERGMRLGDMMKQNKIRDLELQKQNAIDEAFKAGQVQNPDGSVSFDKSITLKQLMSVDPREAQKAEMQFQQQDIMKQKNNANLLFQESMKSLQNPAYYPTAVDTLTQNGIIKPGEAPPAFDESFVKMAAARAGDAKDYLDSLRKEQESQARLSETKMNNDFRREELGLRRLERKDAADAKAEQKRIDMLPENRMLKLNSGDKARLDNSKLGLEYIQKMDDALVGGDNTFSMIGDNDYTSSQALAAEAFGRMQSGGAIQKDEERRFLAMGPQKTDSIKIQRQKLLNQQKLFADRLGTLGFKPEDVGLELRQIKYGTSKEPEKVKQELNSLSDKQLEELYFKNGGQ